MHKHKISIFSILQNENSKSYTYKLKVKICKILQLKYYKI